MEYHRAYAVYEHDIEYASTGAPVPDALKLA
jgi:hypothetical protein